MGAFACIGLLSCAQHDIGQAASEIASASGDDLYPGNPDAQKQADAVVAFLASPTATSGFCTGTLIAAEWVLTAAHCVRSNYNWNDVRVFIGSSLSTPTPARQYRVASCREHPSAYPVAASTTGNPPGCGGGGDVEYRRFDVALVHLTVQSGVDQPTGNWAVPMPVLTNVARPAGIFPAKWEYEPVQLVGWGRLGSFGNSPETSVRQRGTNRINVYQQGTVAKFSQTFELARTPIGGLGLLSAMPGYGDSGGPLLWLDRMFTNRPAVIGVTSGLNFIPIGDEPERSGAEGYAPTVLSRAALNDETRIAPGDWIEQQMNDGPPLAEGQAAIRWLSEPTGTEDNCPLVRNPDQTDSDGDKLGDACDPTPLFAEDEQQRLYGYLRYRLYPLGQQGVRMYACADRAAESEGGRQILEFDAPGPCARVHFMNVPSRLTKTVIGGLCTVGGNKIQIAYDPVRNASDPRAATVQNGVALRRCACWDLESNAPFGSETGCYSSAAACRNNGVLRRNDTTVQGTGWLFEYTPVPALPLTAFESVRTYYRSMDILEFEGSIWNLVPRLIPRFSFSSTDSLQRYAAWRTEIGGAPALEFDWRGYDSNPSDLDPERRRSDLWPMNYPAFAGGVNDVAPIVYWTRAQAEPRAMTGAGNPLLPLDPLSPRHREQRSSDHYTSMVRALREQAPVACRFNSSMNEWWSIPGQGADFAPRFLHPSVDTDHVTPQDRLVDREMVAVIPIAGSAQGLSEFMWSNASTSSPVRGVAIGQLNVRNALWTIVADSQGTAANLPTRSRAAYAQSRPDEWGWPVVYAFGGVDHNAKLSNAFYRGTPVQHADLNVTYEWQRITGANAPVPRVEHSLAVGGSGRYVYVAGGRDADGTLLGDVHRFDSETNAWTLVTDTLTPRAQMGVAAADDLLYLGGGVEASGYESGLIVRINGLSGVVSHSVNALPTGAWPDLSVSPHTDGLIYAGGRVGSTWYRDIWRVDFNDTTATASFLHDFGSDGLVASEHYAVQGDLLHGFFWGVPGRTNGANALGTWFVDGNSQGQVTQPGSGGVGLLRVAGPTSPARQRGSRLVTRRIGPTRPGSTTAGVR